MEEGMEEKWEGEVWVELKSAKAEEIWPMFEDFCSIYKWFPSLDTSYQLEGDSGKPGLVRYCASTGDGPDRTVRWAKEKLLTMDPVRRCLSYQVLDNNVGFDAYVATIEVVAMDCDENGGCKIKWSFVCSPIQGWKMEDLAFLMAPNGESHAKILSSRKSRPSRLSMEGLQRTVSDISIELSKGAAIESELEPISEIAVEDAKCECCGMSEECTVEYIKSTRDKFYGKLICGLCGEAVEEEIEKKRSEREVALKEHMKACVRFNRIDVKYPVLYQAEAFKEMMKKSSSRNKSIGPGDKKDGGLARSSSCIPAISTDVNKQTMII